MVNDKSVIEVYQVGDGSHCRSWVRAVSKTRVLGCEPYKKAGNDSRPPLVGYPACVPIDHGRERRVILLHRRLEDVGPRP